jgi:hypothetical protein
LEQENAFKSLMESLTSTPILTYADYSKPVILNIDTSGLGLGSNYIRKLTVQIELLPMPVEVNDRLTGTTQLISLNYFP